ncbi:MAG: pilus assembly protein PilM [Candidatus Moranbacteria bacterium]|nr:pilus assembly protein PilM [Candidatus Moranbacteria bacterium]
MDIESKIKSYFSEFSNYFHKEKNYSIGVDVGSNNFKIVELEKKDGKILLKNYALVRVSEDTLKENSSDIGEYTGKVLKKVFDDVGIKNREVNTAVPSTSALITLLDIDAKKTEYLEQAVELEAPKYIPVKISDVVYDWQVVGEQNISDEDDSQEKKNKDDELSAIQEEASGKSTKKILLVSVMKEISKNFESVFTKNDFEVESLEIDCFSVKRALTDKKGSYIILDIGGKVANIIGTYKGDLIFNRNIDKAGDRLTELISQTLGVSKDKAEKLKIEKGLEMGSADAVENIVKPFFDSIADQVRKAINEFTFFYGKEGVDALILTGGTSQMNGIKKYLDSKLDLKVYYGNPWSKVSYPPELEGKINSLSPYFSIAVGLALSGFESKKN